MSELLLNGKPRMAAKHYSLKETQTLGNQPIPLFQIWRSDDIHGKNKTHIEGYYQLPEMVSLQNFLDKLLSEHHENLWKIEIHDLQLSVSLEPHYDGFQQFIGYSIDACSLYTYNNWIDFEYPDEWEEEIIALVREEMSNDQ